MLEVSIIRLSKSGSITYLTCICKLLPNVQQWDPIKPEGQGSTIEPCVHSRAMHPQEQDQVNHQRRLYSPS